MWIRYPFASPETVTRPTNCTVRLAPAASVPTLTGAEMLRQASNLDAKDATSYARLWSNIYTASMEPADIATFKVMAEIFRVAGTIEGNVPDSLFATGPYEKAKR